MGSLFEKYGGVLAVHDIVSAFYDRVLDDDALADYFINSDMEALVKHQTNFISSLMGGRAVCRMRASMKPMSGWILTVRRLIKMVSYWRKR